MAQDGTHASGSTQVTLYTIGYRGRKAVDLAKLLPAGTLVVDVRLNPYSPNPEWSTDIGRHLAAVGLDYRAERGLGNLDYKTGGIRIADPARVAAIVDELDERDVALLCACSASADCHRLEVARLVTAARPGTKILHIELPTRRAVLASEREQREQL